MVPRGETRENLGGAFLWVEINESEELKRSLSTSRRWNEFSELEGWEVGNESGTGAPLRY